RRFPLAMGGRHRAAVVGRRASPGDLVRAGARLLHLVPDRRPLDAAALPLRSADAARLAGGAAALAGEAGRLGPPWRPFWAVRVNPVVFVALAALTVLSAFTVVLHRNPVHSACALVVTLFLLAVFFVGLDAPLVAVLQVIVYAGAVVVLFLFVIMLLNLQVEA